MVENLEPLSAREKKILELAGPFEPPVGAEERVFGSLQASIAATASVAAGSAATSQAGGLLSAKAVTAIAGAMLAVGVGTGVLLGRTTFAPEPPPPTVVERVVRVEVPVPAVATPTPEPAASVRVAPVPKAHPPVLRAEPTAPLADELLAQERELIDTARSALLHGDGSAALTTLQAHADKFPAGRLDEERESLWVQALVMKGSLPAARARAAQFHQKFPRSLLGPTVDAAVSDAP